jgi:hypothetical protein
LRGASCTFNNQKQGQKTMARNTKEIALEKLLTIKLKPVANYLGAFGSEQQENLQLERLVAPAPAQIELLQSAFTSDKDLQALVAEIKKPVADDNKGQVVQMIKDFFNTSPYIIISLKDNQGAFQPAFLLWYKKVDYAQAEIKNLDKKTGFIRFVAVNKNLDKSYGAQAEIPRIKLSAGINTLLNYQFFKSCEKFGQLLSSNLIFANDLIEKQDVVFAGADIKNRGNYDNKEQYNALFGDDGAKASKKQPATSASCDLYM